MFSHLEVDKQEVGHQLDFYFVVTSNEDGYGKCIGVKVHILGRKCSGVKVKVVRNINNEVKYRYVKILLKYSNEVFVLCYITTLLFSEVDRPAADAPLA